MDRALAAVLRKIEEDHDHVVALTQDLVRIPSVNRKPQIEDGLNREGDVQTRIQEELRPMGFELDRWDALPDHRNLTANLPGNVAGYTFELVVGDAGEGSADAVATAAERLTRTLTVFPIRPKHG